MLLELYQTKLETTFCNSDRRTRIQRGFSRNKEWARRTGIRVYGMRQKRYWMELAQGNLIFEE